MVSNEEISALLKETRQKKDIELSEAAKELNIRKEYLELLEDGNFQALESQIYIAGCLRSYAQWLGLDANDVVNKFKETKSPASLEKLSPTKPTYAFATADDQKPGYKKALILLIAAVVIYGIWKAANTPKEATYSQQVLSGDSDVIHSNKQSTQTNSSQRTDDVDSDTKDTHPLNDSTYEDDPTANTEDETGAEPLKDAPSDEQSPANAEDEDSATSEDDNDTTATDTNPAELEVSTDEEATGTNKPTAMVPSLKPTIPTKKPEKTETLFAGIDKFFVIATDVTEITVSDNGNTATKKLKAGDVVFLNRQSLSTVKGKNPDMIEVYTDGQNSQFLGVLSDINQSAL